MLAVRGLTTAAIVWVTCAIGMACGAGLWLLALVVTVGRFVVVLYGGRSGRPARRPRRVHRARIRDRAHLDAAPRRGGELQGQPGAERLAVALTDLDGVLEVTTTDLGGD